MKRKLIEIDPLPGCEPYENCRTMRVRQSHDGLSLINFLHQLHPPIPLGQWRAWIAAGEITLHDPHFHVDQAAHANQVVTAGQCFLHRMPDTIEPEVANRIAIVHEDDSILVVDKPAPLPVHPSGRFNRNTLVEMLRSSYEEPNLRIAHRLDANTTGLVLFCRTSEAARYVQPQFERRTVVKEYVAVVPGIVPWDRHRCELPIGRAAELSDSKNTRGARIVHPDGQPAETHFEVLRRLPCEVENSQERIKSKTLVRAIPITGRTNQIRVHLWSLGFPIEGDPLYLSGGLLGQQQTLAVGHPPMCLHARRLTITHPETRLEITFEQPAAFEYSI